MKINELIVNFVSDKIQSTSHVSLKWGGLNLKLSLASSLQVQIQFLRSESLSQ